MNGDNPMKIELQYKEPETQIAGYIFNAVYDVENIH